MPPPTRPAPTLTLSHPRYEALAFLGRGAQGAVLAVRDREAEHLPLVAKVWSGRDVDVAEARAEFALLSRVRSPTLARAHDLGFDVATRAPFLVEERVSGPDLREAVGALRLLARREPSEANGALASLLGQLLVSVGALHRAGFLHGDLKPAHVRFRGGGDALPLPVLLDLGCALARSLRASTGETVAQGVTVRFAAPEVLAGDAKTVRSDLYALGASVRACLGRPSSPSEPWLEPWIEPRVAEVLASLVSPRAEGRPADAEDALDRLGEAVARGGRRAALLAPRLEVARAVGREGELAALLGARGTLYVTGPAGVGKSHVLREAFIRAKLAGRAARAYTFPDVPTAVVLELVKSLRAGELPLPGEDAAEGAPLLVLDALERAPREVAAALESYRCATPEGRIAILAERREAPPGAASLAIAPLPPEAVESLATSLGLWGERRARSVAAARGVPAWLVAAAGGAPLAADAVLAAARSLPDDAQSALHAIAALGGAVPERDLALSKAGGQALRSSGLVVREHALEARRPAGEAASPSAGEPSLRLFAQEVAAEVADALATDRRVAEAAALALGPRGFGLPADAKVALAADRRVDPETSKRLLRDAAASARRAGATEVEASALLALGAAGDRTREVLTRAERLLRDSGRAAAYPQIVTWLEDASLVDPSLLPLARRRAAERAARAGRHDDARALAEDTLALARARGSRFDEAAALSTGGALALYRADIDAAATLLEQAASLLEACPDEDDEERARLEHNRAVVAMHRGLYEEATRRLASALAMKRRLGDRAGARACLLNLGLAAHRLGDLDGAERFLDEAIALAVSLDQAQGRGWCLAARADVALTRGDEARARRAVAEARALGEALPAAVRADLSLLEAELALAAGSYGEVGARLGDLAPELLAADALVDARARTVRASAALGGGQRRGAARLALGAVRRAREAKIPHLEARAWGIFRDARMKSPPRALWPWLTATARGADRVEALVSLLAAAIAETRAERAFLVDPSDAARVVGVDADGLALTAPERRLDLAELLREAALPAAARGAIARSARGAGSRVVVPSPRDGQAPALLVVEHRYSAGHFDAVDDEVLRAFAAAAALTLRLDAPRSAAPSADERAAEREGAAWPAAPSAAVADDHEETTYFPAARGEDRFASIVGQSLALARAKARLAVAARSDLSVLLTGETGTGKEVFARALHEGSARARGPFVALNCGAVPENLFEAELFGHARGAYTGADRARPGLLAQCEGGTLLLDEIGELAVSKQAALLRALEARRYRAVGSDEERAFDVRVVAATNRDLQAEVARGAFRLDLLYRLDVLAIALPSLRERTGDVRPLVAHFLGRAGRELDLSADAWEALEAYAWPGNVRELEHEIARLLALDVRRVGRSSLSRRVRGGERAADRAAPSAPGARPGGRAAAPLEPPAAPARADVTASAAATERLEVERALASQGGNLTHTAKALGLSRQGLKKKMIRLGLRAPAERPGGPS